MCSEKGLNLRPPDYESGATNQLSYRTNFSPRFFWLISASDFPSSFVGHLLYTSQNKLRSIKEHIFRVGRGAMSDGQPCKYTNFFANAKLSRLMSAETTSDFDLNLNA